MDIGAKEGRKSSFWALFNRNFVGLMMLITAMLMAAMLTAANDAAAWSVADGVIDLPPGLENELQLQEQDQPKESTSALSLKKTENSPAQYHEMKDDIKNEAKTTLQN